MGVQTENNPFGSDELMVTKVLGSAYDVVKCVFQHLSFIKVVANNMDAVVGSANNIHRNIVVETDTTPDLGETKTILLPDEITQGKVLDFNVLVVGSDDALYSAAEGYFTAKIVSGALSFTLAADAPEELEGAELRWVISYES